MTTQVSQLLAIAKGEVGYHEGRSNGHWNNVEKYAAQVAGLAWVSTSGSPWCAVFVSWCAMKAGAADLYPCTASTDAGAAWFKQRGQWSTYPAVGAQIFFGVNGNMDHTGIVCAYDATTVYTVEGNTNTNGSVEGDGVYLKSHPRRDPRVQGYGYPAGIITDSADPTFKAPAPPPSRPTAGPNVEQAIKNLRAAKAAPKSVRASVLASVLKALRGLRK